MRDQLPGLRAVGSLSVAGSLPAPPPETDVEALAATVREALDNYGTWRMQQKYRQAASIALTALLQRIEALERESEIARIKGHSPEDARRYFEQRDEWADRYVQAQAQVETLERERDENAPSRPRSQGKQALALLRSELTRLRGIEEALEAERAKRQAWRTDLHDL
jgi:hypothetical protein